MGTFVNGLKTVWLYMLDPPWRHFGPDDERGAHWIAWLVGWAWALAGLVLGALVAPSLVQFAGLSATSYQDWLVIGVAVLAGFFVQFLGWCAFGLAFAVGHIDSWPAAVEMLMVLVVVALPLGGVSYALYRYFTWVGAGRGVVTTAFVGSLLVKTFILPAIAGAVKSKAFKLLLYWLRGNDTTLRGA